MLGARYDRSSQLKGAFHLHTKLDLRRWPLAAYLFFSVLMTWPLVSRLGTAIPSDTGSDMLVHEWTLWWLRESLLHLRNPLVTDLLLKPAGVALTSHNIAWLNFGLSLPLIYVWGQAAATSVTYLAIFTFNAYAMYLFAYHQTRSQAGAWVAGLVFGFFPVTLSDAGHVNMLLTGWLPLALVYLDRVITHGGRHNYIMAGLFLALLGITRWQLLAIGAIPAALFVLYSLSIRRQQLHRRTLLQLAAGSSFALLLMVPFLLPLVVDQLSRSDANDLLVYEPAFSADLLGYFVPHPHLFAWDWLARQLPSSLQFTQQEIIFWGYTVLVLVAVALILRWRSSWIWLLMAGVLIVLAMGPVVTIGQQKYDWIYTPYRLIEDTFYNKLIRKPWRYNVFLGLPLAMLAAIGVAALRQHRRRLWSGAFVALLSLLILVEYRITPYPMLDLGITPAWYHQLAKDPEQFSIVGMPISSRWADKYYMYYQMEHRKPMVGGHVSRPTLQTVAYMAGSPFLYDMLYRREMDPALVDVTHQLRYLAGANVRYVILHKNFVSGEKIEAWKDWLTFAPVFEDGMTVVYRTAPQAGVDFQIEHSLLPALGTIHTACEPSQLQEGEPLTVDIRWGTQSAVGADYDYCIDLVGLDGGVAQQECQPISPQWPTGRWAANEVARSAHTFRSDPFLSAGEYHVEVTLRDPATGAAVGEPLNLGRVQVSALPRVFTPPNPQVVRPVRFGSDIHLYGYDLGVDGDAVKLVLYWSAARRLARSYKVFVHAVDAKTGALLAQYDAAPRNWAYPTTWWEAGEVVADPIALPLNGADPAGVQLQFGLYDEATGQRLALSSESPAAPESGDALAVSLPARH